MSDRDKIRWVGARRKYDIVLIISYNTGMYRTNERGLCVGLNLRDDMDGGVTVYAENLCA